MILFYANLRLREENDEFVLYTSVNEICTRLDARILSTILQIRAGTFSGDLENNDDVILYKIFHQNKGD